MKATIPCRTGEASLEAYLGGELAADEARRFERHLADCTDCRRVARAFELLARDLERPDRERSDEHCSSEELARQAGRADGLDRRVAAHLRVCSRCMTELQIVARAVEEARGSSRPSRWTRWAGAAAGSPRRAWALAASLSLVLGAAAFTLIDRSPRVVDSFLLSEGRIAGDRTVEAGDAIVVRSSSIGGGANVTLRSGRIVTFGDGFSVQDSARLKVDVRRDKRGSES